MDDNDASNKYNKTTFWMTGSLLLLPKLTKLAAATNAKL
jgi:hypothetical protein